TDLAPGGSAYYVVSATVNACSAATGTINAGVWWGCSAPLLNSPGSSASSASLVTDPTVTGAGTVIGSFTTLTGTVTLSFTVNNTNVLSLTVTSNLSNRYQLASPISYVGLPAPAVAPPLGPLGGTPLLWQWPGPVTPGAKTITFSIRDAAGSC